MATRTQNRFDLGIAESRFSRAVGQCGACKHFDLTTFPYKMVPYRGLTANTATSTRIGNIIIASNGIPHGLGTEPSNNQGQLYDKTTIAADWASMSNGDPGAVQGSFRVLTEFGGYIYQTYGIKSGGAYNDGSADGIWWTQIGNAASNFQAFSSDATTVANAVVHPATGYLYIPHDNLIARITAVGSGYTDAAFTLPTGAVITSIVPFGNYLAIAARLGSATRPISKVFFWDLSSTTWTDAIDWDGDLQVIHTLRNSLIGVSLNSHIGYSVDRNGVTLRHYELGGVPTKIRDITTERQTSTDPSAQVNPNVAFTLNDKLYFSIDIVGGSTSPKYYGLWSVSRSLITGEWSVTIEQGATSDNSETSVLAAAKLADYAWLVHTANGTVTRTINTSGVNATIFDATSFYETVVNPNMPDPDYHLKKQLKAARLNFYLPDATSQVILKVRGDRATSWTTLFTKTASSPDTDAAGYRTTDISLIARFLEFRIESIGGAEITGLSYDYDIIPD